MESGASPGAVVLLALGIGVGTIAIVFVGGWLYGRYLKVKLRGSTEIERRHMALIAQNWKLYAQWQWRVFPFAMLGLVLFFLGLVLFPLSLLFSWLLIWGLGSSFLGLQTRDLRYVLVNPPIQPMRLLTGDAALVYAGRLLRRGIGLLVAWGVLVAVGALVTFLL